MQKYYLLNPQSLSRLEIENKTPHSPIHQHSSLVLIYSTEMKVNRSDRILEERDEAMVVVISPIELNGVLLPTTSPQCGILAAGVDNI